MQNREQKVHEKQIISLFSIKHVFQCGCEIEKKLFRIGKAHKAITAKANEKTVVGKLSAFNVKGSRVIRPAVKDPLPEIKGR